ncbi:serine hydrolase domain-containing protein [Roseomonas sp. CCTCC AB2023176]|uniref:serine hydrolase domain-containing protein n=1 Tax=Roseomonas sp. CCTCC AB2023176 TaxID=3342640 RepID=UPI0035D5B8CD
MMHPDLTRAAAEASAIAGGWSEERGPGGAIVLFDAGGPRAAGSGGYAVPEHEVPFTPDTPSRWASISKQFCAATVLLAGFDLDAPLGTLVSGLPGPIGAVPVGRALDMTGGIPDVMETLWLLGQPYTTGVGEADLLAFCRRLPGVAGPPGREMTYSNTGWRLAGAAFPEQRGETYGAALRRLLLEPLGLTGIAFPEDETTLIPRLATPCWHDGTSWRRGRYGMHFSPSGGLAGSATDLARWGSALLAGRGPAEGLLEALSAHRAMANGSPSFYGLGFARVALGEVGLLGHGGSLTGIKTHLLMAPAMGCGVAVITNRETAEPLRLAMTVMAAMTGQPLPSPGYLPPGLYAEAEGEAWAEVDGATMSFMGASDHLFAAGEGARTLPSYLDMSWTVTAAGALEGRAGGVARRLVPVPPETPLSPGLVGTWRHPEFGAELEVRADGTALLPGGPIRDSCALRPLPNGGALADRRHGPWRQRPVLVPRADGTLLLASHRSRVLRFRRA